MKRDYYIIRGRFTWRQIARILDKKFTDEYPDQIYNSTGDSAPCGLMDGPITYKIYSDQKAIGSQSAHICLHSDGICFSGSLNIDQDWKLARELSEEIKKNIKE